MFKQKYRNVLKGDCDNRRVYDIRRKMIQRCTDPSSERYADYGGRGIKVCDEWLDDFDAFADWAKESGYEKGLTIDRIDNDGNYEPSNCRWVTRKEQNRNKRNTFMVTYRGETKPLKTWCEELDLHYDITHHRLTHGQSPEKAFEMPLTTSKESFAAMCRRHNMKPSIVYDRIHRFGWTLEDALNTPTGVLGSHRKANCGEAVCPICGKTFVKIMGRQKYCTRDCHDTARKARYKKG